MKVSHVRTIKDTFHNIVKDVNTAMKMEYIPTIIPPGTVLEVSERPAKEHMYFCIYTDGHAQDQLIVLYDSEVERLNDKMEVIQ